jgi:hypothetical protein
MARDKQSRERWKPVKDPTDPAAAAEFFFCFLISPGLEFRNGERRERGRKRR